jgi:hypothetical protein
MGEQAAYGRSALAATSFFTYVGLGLGFLATTLSLPFGIFVLVCQREPVRYIQVRGPVPNKALPISEHYKQSFSAVKLSNLHILFLTAADLLIADCLASG